VKYFIVHLYCHPPYTNNNVSHSAISPKMASVSNISSTSEITASYSIANLTLIHCSN